MMLISFNRNVLFPLSIMILSACGGDSTAPEADHNESNAAGHAGSDTGSDDVDDPVSEKDPITVVTGDVERSDLGFATLTAMSVTLPEAKLNAKEQYQVAHYIGRTDSEQNEENIDIPIRSYTATCATDTRTPRMFVSVSLSEGTRSQDATYGSVYELQYNPATENFEQTGNATVLNQCYESHGITASQDCSRIAVLCNTGYQANATDEVDADLIEQYGTDWMKTEDNESKIESRIQNDIGLMVATNHNPLIHFFTEHFDLTIQDFLAGLQANFPENNFDSTTTFNTIKGSEMAEEMAYIISQLTSTDHADLLDHIRNNSYKYNDQIWLLEWDGNQSLSDKPAAYVVNKMHGGTHLGTQELIYVDDDSQGRSSYAFSVTARVFDGYGSSHYSAGLTVIDRDNWKIDDSARGWYWTCGNGHVLNIRSFYNPDRETYGALCTSDWNDWIGSSHGQLGTIAIKMDVASSSTEGVVNHFVPATSAMVSNGGGHTVVPVDFDTNLSVIVSPKYIDDADMERFLINEVGVDMSTSSPFDAQCAEYDTVNCFISYMSHEYWERNGLYPTVERQGLYSANTLDTSSLTRIGIAKVDGERGRMNDSAFHWVVQDDDCQISDPQLIDLQNGRYLLGYARFQCLSDGLSFDRIYSDRGAMRMLVPKDFHVMEIDSDFNVLAGPIKLPNHGWGGLDEPMFLGKGKVAWTYIKNPTIESYGGGQQNEWEVMVYHSNSVAN
ncbi:hypothetical protein [Shewanella surugensis]|uniref:Uncharacterized protein n=1 Tax=Shewanella surugensis TaxID=212020 RepID=A0ABT0LGH2_9GAMM|nr:hypothetical protein [Shewanella surugensis]MCL1126585.1 hypothetical protein [Shewanella surugensis]